MRELKLPEGGCLTRPPSCLGAGPGWEQKALLVLSAYFCHRGDHQGEWLTLSGPLFSPRDANTERRWGIMARVTRSPGTSPLKLSSLSSLMLGASPERALGGGLAGGGGLHLSF